ncbi:MAG: class I SAM-dependent rRNA methyltransferase [Fibrobacter sp.]|nr:class I SAM-dependent rRNA methyltransferase [Fibrobacter sp.]
MKVPHRDIIAENLRQAGFLRKNMVLSSNAFRWCNGVGDALENLVIDVYNRHIQITLYHPVWQEHLGFIAAFMEQLTPVDFMVVKGRFSADGKLLSQAPLEILRGKSENSQCTVQEGNVFFVVDLLDTVNPGLFLDMRAQRLALAQRIKPGQSLLNLFSYTGSFSVHARLAGAQKVVNVDISSKIHGRTQLNYATNGIEAQKGEFFRGDARQYLNWARRKGLKFDHIVLDPPTFSRSKKDIFRVQNALPELMEQCLSVLNSKGSLLVATNCNALSSQDLSALAQKTVKQLKLGKIKVQHFGQDQDFVGSGLHAASHLAGIVVHILS